MDTWTRRPPLAPITMRPAVIAGLGLAVLWGCSSATQSAGGFRAENRSNLERLTTGMSRSQVISIMGTKSAPRPLGTESSGQARTERDSMGVTQVQILTGSSAPALYNPMRTGTYATSEHTWEVLFYYARLVEDDGIVSEDELEPVVLRDGFLAGVGWQYWKEIAGQEGINLDLTTPD